MPFPCTFSLWCMSSGICTPTRRLQRVRLFLCSCVLYMPWIPGEHRRGICAVECVTAHLRGFEEDSRSEVVFWIDEWSIEFGCHWLMLLMFLTAHLFQFRFVDSLQYCNMALRLRCRRHKFLVVRLLSCACHLFSCELCFATDDVASRGVAVFGRAGRSDDCHFRVPAFDRKRTFVESLAAAYG